jgi:hypothetical protein
MGDHRPDDGQAHRDEDDGNPGVFVAQQGFHKSLGQNRENPPFLLFAYHT